MVKNTIMIKLSIIDDHRVFVEALQSLLSKEEGFDIAHCYYSDQIPTVLLGFEDTDVVLLDINLGTGNGIDLCLRIKKVNPNARILFFSAFQHQSTIVRAMKSGAAGYLLKNCGRTELLEAIKCVSGGKTYFSPEIVQIVMERYADTTQRSVQSITPREKEILYWIVNELSNAEIAEKLGISIKTVEIHRMRLLSKFGVKNTAGLVRKAMEQNIIT